MPVWGPTACRHCGRDIEQKERGRPRLYCSDACRQAGNRYGNPCVHGHPEGSHRRCWCNHPPRRASRW